MATPRDDAKTVRLLTMLSNYHDMKMEEAGRLYAELEAREEKYLSALAALCEVPAVRAAIPDDMKPGLRKFVEIDDE